jgi:hypothetical protein
MRTFFELFARSPFAPLIKHGEKVHEVLLELEPLFDAFMGGDRDAVAGAHERISHLEHEADQIKREIRDNLPRSLFLPVDRGDLLRFLKEQDAIADAVEDVAVLMNMRATPTPGEMKPRVTALVSQIVRTGESWFEIIQLLPELQESSFTGPEVKKVVELIDRVHAEEYEADLRQAALGRDTVRCEEELGAVSVLFWMRIASKLGEVANRAENSGDLLRLMLARS